MGRKEPAKGIHTSPQKAGAKNMPPIMPKDEDGTTYHAFQILLKGEDNKKAYKGLWDEASLKEQVLAYFEYCTSNDFRVSKVGLALWLGVSKAQYHEWENQPEKYSYKSDILEFAGKAIESTYMGRAEKYPTANIFFLKALHNVQETTKVEITNTQIKPDEVQDMVSKLGLDKINE